jgi:hypothetical protein
MWAFFKVIQPLSLSGSSLVFDLAMNLANEVVHGCAISWPDHHRVCNGRDPLSRVVGFCHQVPFENVIGTSLANGSTSKLRRNVRESQDGKDSHSDSQP